MTPYLMNAALFLIQLVFGFYVTLVLLRFLFQLARASFYNPMAQFVVTLTNPPLKFLRRLIPGAFGIDWAAVLLLIALKLAEIYLVSAVLGLAPSFAETLLLTIVLLLKLTVWVLIFSIFVRALLSWVNPYGTRHPVSDLLYSLTEPLLYRARRLIPAPQGIDLSPLVALALLWLTLMLIIAPLEDLCFALDRQLALIARYV